MTRSYSMRGVQGAAHRGVRLTREYLAFREPGSRVHDVQEDPRFQHRGVDLLWELPGGKVLGVEVKADRQGRRGNFFLELVSNLERDTPGCFLYSEADVLAYVFLDAQQLWHLPLSAMREWFLPRARGYPLRHTQTQTGKVRYTTVGALVPVQDVLGQVPGAERFRLTADGPVRMRGGVREKPAAGTR